MKFVRVIVAACLLVSIVLYGAGVIRENRNYDPTMPVITSTVDVLEITTDYTQEDLLSGLSAWDDGDGDLTGEILVGDFSQFIEPGLSNLTYVVFDSNNQAGTLTRQVRFTDYESPKLTLSQPLVFTVGSRVSVSGIVGAEDMLDGDLSALVLETGSDVNSETQGTYTVDVEVTNSFGDVEEASLPVHVIRSRELEITLTENLVYLHTGDSFSPENYVQDITDYYGNTMDLADLQITSQVDTQTPGCYEVHYYGENDAGQTGETWLTVIVRD